MRRYQIYCYNPAGGNVLIGDLAKSKFEYYNGKLEEGKNEAESLSFSLTNDNPNINQIFPMGSTIALYEDFEIRWVGRPTRIAYDIYGNVTVNCEGVIAWLCDIIIPDYSLYPESTEEAITQILVRYNLYSSDFREITTGILDANYYPNDERHISGEYISTSDLMKQAIESMAGRCYITYDGLTPIFNYTSRTNNVEHLVLLTENLMQITRDFDATKVMTMLYATGDGIALSDVLINSSAIKTFGNIQGYHNFPNITDEDTLEYEARQFLKQNILGDNTIEVKALDLSTKDNTKRKIRVGQVARVLSPPHGIDIEMEIIHVSTDLNDPSRTTVTLGQSPYTLTRLINAKG